MCNAYKKLQEIHREYRVRGIQDKPKLFVEISNSTGGELYGFLGSKYDGNLLQSVKGGDLSREPLEVIMDCCDQLFSAVNHLSTIGLRHGDIKPENIFVRKRKDEGYDVHLADFGGARFFHEIDVKEEKTNV